MKHSLQLKLSQHLTLTPQLQQSIRLLQLSTVELNQELERYLAENPLLERADLAGDEPQSAPAPEPATTEAEPATPADEAASFGDEPMGGSRRNDEDRDDFTQIAAAEPTLQENLIRQLQLTALSERDKRLALLVIAHLDGDGYLTAGLDELHAIGAAEIPDLEAEEVSIALRQVQNLEPVGVGARDLAECLALQLKALDPHVPHRERRDRGHLHDSGRLGLSLRHALLSKFCFVQDIHAVLIEDAAGFGQAELARRAVQKLHRQRELQRADLPTRERF